MVAAVGAEVTQADAMILGAGFAAEARATQLDALAIGIYPSEFGQVSQVDVMVPLATEMLAEISQLDCYVVARGRVSNPQLVVWTFTLDDHDMYVLKLGDGETLVFDTATSRWANWGTENITRWRPQCGVNWPGAAGISPGTMVVTGEDNFGTLYFLDPVYPYDDNPTTGVTDAQAFVRIAQGQIIHRGDTPADCFGVSLMGSFGAVYDNSLTSVKLEYSDDAGNTYDDAGTVEIDPGDYSVRVEWTSLGLIVSPGRLFKITDSGSLARIDSLDWIGPDDAGT